jgi:hypothetical protein
MAWFWAIVVLIFIFWLMTLVVIWFTLWARRLRKRAGVREQGGTMIGKSIVVSTVLTVLLNLVFWFWRR